MNEIRKPNPNSPDYWPMRRGAFRAINRVHDLTARAEQAPRYLASGFDENGEATDIFENTGPYEAVDRTVKNSLSTNPFVRETLEAWGVRVHQPTAESWPALRNKKGQMVRSWEIPAFETSQRKTP